MTEENDVDSTYTKTPTIQERVYGLELRYGYLNERVKAIEGKMNWLLGFTFTTLVAIVSELIRGIALGGK